MGTPPPARCTPAATPAAPPLLSALPQRLRPLLPYRLPPPLLPLLQFQQQEGSSRHLRQQRLRLLLLLSLLSAHEGTFWHQ
jgi:hypothetical protein